MSYWFFSVKNINFKEYDCRDNNCDDAIANNFYLIPTAPLPPPPNTCVDFDPTRCKDPNAPYNDHLLVFLMNVVFKIVVKLPKQTVEQESILQIYLIV